MKEPANTAHPLFNPEIRDMLAHLRADAGKVVHCGRCLKDIPEAQPGDKGAGHYRVRGREIRCLPCAELADLRQKAAETMNVLQPAWG